MSAQLTYRIKEENNGKEVEGRQDKPDQWRLYRGRGSMATISCYRAAATICPRASSPPVGTEAPRAAEQTAT